MSVMLATQNPEAHERLARNAPLPEVGEPVRYYPRHGERRQGRDAVPAVVVKVDHENERVDLIVIYDAEDRRDMQNVPERRGDDHGFELLPNAAAVERRLENFMTEMAGVLFGDQPKPESGSMLEAMGSIWDKLDEIENALKALGSKKK